MGRGGNKFDALAGSVAWGATGHGGRYGSVFWEYKAKAMKIKNYKKNRRVLLFRGVAVGPFKRMKRRAANWRELQKELVKKLMQRQERLLT